MNLAYVILRGRSQVQKRTCCIQEEAKEPGSVPIILATQKAEIRRIKY
jgi:hypothetical protein